jgi:hypothetical protein
MSALKLGVSNPPQVAQHPNPHEAITKATVTRLAKLPKSVKDVYVTDSELPGFRLRRTPSGTLIFEFRGRIRGGEGTHKN